ncbi:hypothetical protein OG949_25735 [Streptomyces scopuliridis]|uniref:hypothetical protein n=1 Tax=Streptomyces scopuliridis TaxID=452529 RepID=UPI002DD7BA05|nr:hypothetical protein [Streptomyces scopuliridis]WSB35910.1 hypothetical protein OG949_25735 [Streptomyces scopuliridis]
MKQLYGTAFRCGKPDCQRPLFRLDNETGDRTLNSRVAHIHARREGGPRWNPGMPDEANRSGENLLLLCIEHSYEIDDNAARFPPEMLREWKAAQLAEHDQIQRSWHLSNDEAAEASALSFDPHQLSIATASATTVTAVARAVGKMVSVGRQRRRLAHQAAQAWEVLRLRTNRTMPVFDLNGDRLTVEPSRAETKPYEEALTGALAESQAELEPLAVEVIAELHAVSAVDQSLGQWCDWVERQVEELIAAAGRWPGRPPTEDDQAWPDAVAELQRASASLSAAWRGDRTVSPPEPAPAVSGPAETDLQRAVREHCELLELAGPWGRVKHRDYDAALYARLMGALPLANALPPVPSLTAMGLDLTARRAATVARNADETTYRALIRQATEQTPLAAAVFLLQNLGAIATQQGHEALQDAAAAEASNLLLAEDWKSPAVWADNRNHARRLLAWTADAGRGGEVRETLKTAIEANQDLLPSVIEAMGQWGEAFSRDGTDPTRMFQRISELPDWFPVALVAVLIKQTFPEVSAADEFASERYSDVVQQLASQILWIAEGNSNQ